MSARSKAKRLVRLAADSRTPEKEAFAAAFQACRIIAEHDLLGDPLADVLPEDDERVDAARSVYRKLTDPEFVRGVKTLVRAFGRGRRR